MRSPPPPSPCFEIRPFCLGHPRWPPRLKHEADRGSFVVRHFAFSFFDHNKTTMCLPENTCGSSFVRSSTKATIARNEATLSSEKCPGRVRPNCRVSKQSCCTAIAPKYRVRRANDAVMRDREQSRLEESRWDWQVADAKRRSLVLSGPETGMPLRRNLRTCSLVALNEVLVLYHHGQK